MLINSDRSARISTRIMLISGGISFLLGFAVLFGWHSHTLTVLQLRSDFVAMPYNAALGFVLGGVGLILRGLDRRGWAALCGFAVAAVALLTLAEYVLTINLGLDQLFMQHYVTNTSSYPGRMAPNTAFCPISCRGTSAFGITVRFQG